MCVRESAIAAGIPKTALWNDVPPVVLGEVYDVVSCIPFASYIANACIPRR